MQGIIQRCFIFRGFPRENEKNNRATLIKPVCKHSPRIARITTDFRQQAFLIPVKPKVRDPRTLLIMPVKSAVP
jgi:hypothetical protein